MKLVVKTILVLFLLGIITLLYINSKYPFFTYKNGGWSVGYGYQDPSKPFDKTNKTVYSNADYRTNVEETSIFIADPFYITVKDTTYLFFENLTKRFKGGILSYMKSVDRKNYMKGGDVLIEDFHLSYPQVFIYDSSIYMLPETQGSNNVLLYKPVNFPDKWEVVDTLFKDTQIEDPTLLFHNNNVYIFGSYKGKLFYYKGNSLFDDWNQLERKELVSAPNQGRCGGRIFKDKDGSYIIPLQNNANGYGSGISLFKINLDADGNASLTSKNNFYLKGEEGNLFDLGMHHLDVQNYNGDSTYVVFDGKSYDKSHKVFNYKKPIVKFIRDIKKSF